MPSHRPATPPTVMVVDDELVTSDSRCRTLAERGFRYVWADSAGTAFALLRERRYRPDLLILSVGLGDLPGSRRAREIAERFPELPVLFVSDDPAFDPDHYPSRRRSFLPKPFTGGELLGAIESLRSQALGAA